MFCEWIHSYRKLQFSLWVKSPPRRHISSSGKYGRLNLSNNMFEYSCLFFYHVHLIRKHFTSRYCTPWRKNIQFSPMLSHPPQIVLYICPTKSPYHLQLLTSNDNISSFVNLIPWYNVKFDILREPANRGLMKCLNSHFIKNSCKEPKASIDQWTMLGSY